MDFPITELTDVERIEIDGDRNLLVQIRLNLLNIPRKDAESEGSTAGVQDFEGETYTRIQSLPVHRHHSESCG